MRNDNFQESQIYKRTNLIDLSIVLELTLSM
jgi:hypothetical protein